MPPPDLTRHAQAGMRQRGISGEVLDCLLEFGAVCHDHRGGEVLYFDKRARERCRAALAEPDYRRLEGRFNVYAVRASDGALVTVGHRLRRVPRS